MKTNKKNAAPEEKAEKAQSGKAAGAKPAGVTDKLFHKLFRERFHTTPLQTRKASRQLKLQEADASNTK